jgi:hypothetical protein
MKKEILLPKLLEEISLTNLHRIDVALEGDWSSTLVTMWTIKDRFLEFSEDQMSHEVFKPSVELYFDNSWVGIHCFKRIKNMNVFDKELALEIIDYVEARLLNSMISHKQIDK